MKTKQSAVVACVTSQYDCDRIIKIAKEIADSSEYCLRVLSVLKPTVNYTTVADQFEYLYAAAKEAGADMTILFSYNAAKSAAEFVKNSDAVRIVTGMHDGKSNSFLVKFNELSPYTSITMVAKDNMVYSMDLCTARA